MAARISILVFEEDVFHASMDATATVNTALRRKTAEVSYSKLTEEEATEMDEAKSRELAEWIQEGATSKVRESSRLMSMRWVPTWKPSDVLGYQHPEVAELKVASPTLSRLGKMLTLQWTAFNNPELKCAEGDGH